jgi:hypothetical protein
VFLSTGWSEKQTPPFQGRNTPFQVLFGGSAAVGITRARNAVIIQLSRWTFGFSWPDSVPSGASDGDSRLSYIRQPEAID